jgi:enoyl-CoA hydratase
MPISLTYQDEFAILTIDRPAALNALNAALIKEIDQCLDDVTTSSARALIITGAGEKAFCAGADIIELIDKTAYQHKLAMEYGQQVFSRLNHLPIPTIALIQGYAFGGGLELALACTFRVATANAKVGLPEIKLGLIPGYGGTQRLPRLIGESRALELMLTGRTVKADEGVQLGLFNRLVDTDGLTAAVAFAREFTVYSLAAMRSIRTAVNRSLQTSLVEGLKIEADQSQIVYQTQDAQEGMKAFMEKRPPNFSDR